MLTPKQERLERWSIILEGCTSKELEWLASEVAQELERRRRVENEQGKVD